jgi:hypothetical protein
MVTRLTVRWKNPIARRIVTWCNEHDESLSSLSKRAGRHRTTGQRTCENLEYGERKGGRRGGMGSGVLADFAKAMGVTLDWLMYGREPTAPCIHEARTLDGWADAVEEAAAFGLPPEELEGAGFVGIPGTPKRVNAFLVEACARVWRMTNARK